jgi:hypothetical protein
MLLIMMWFRFSDCERSACFDTQIKFRKLSEDRVMIMALANGLESSFTDMLLSLNRSIAPCSSCCILTGKLINFSMSVGK